MKDKPITFGSLTRTAYLFSSALFSLANTLQISPLEKNTPLRCTLAYGSGETRATYQMKKEKDTRTHTDTYGRKVSRVGEDLRQRAPLLFANFHQRGGDGVRSPRPNAK